MITDWRLPVPPDVMENLFWQAAGPLISDDEPSAVLLAGILVLAADGMLVSLADTPANRAFFGCTGTAAEDGEGAPPFPRAEGRRAGRPGRARHVRRDPGTGQGRGSRPC